MTSDALMTLIKQLELDTSRYYRKCVSEAHYFDDGWDEHFIDEERHSWKEVQALLSKAKSRRVL